MSHFRDFHQFNWPSVSAPSAVGFSSMAFASQFSPVIWIRIGGHRRHQCCSQNSDRLQGLLFTVSEEMPWNPVVGLAQGAGCDCLHGRCCHHVHYGSFGHVRCFCKGYLQRRCRPEPGHPPGADQPDGGSSARHGDSSGVLLLSGVSPIIGQECLVDRSKSRFRYAKIKKPAFSRRPLKIMARPRGFEPLTSASGGQRSIQLSYGRNES
jgi:hypothetical protein